MAAAAGRDDEKVHMEPLCSSNYREWSRRMEIALKTKGLWNAVSEEDAASDLQKRKARGLMVQHMDKDNLYEIWDYEDPAEAWEVLKNLHSGDTKARQGMLLCELTDFKMGANESIMKYVSRARELRADLRISGVPMDEHVVVMKLLHGLPDKYHTVVTSLLTNFSQGAGLKFGQVLPTLLPYEKQLAQKEEASAYMTVKGNGRPFAGARAVANERPAAGGGRNGVRDLSGVRCRGCGKLGHLQKDCRLKSVKCHGCHEFGHVKKDCPRKSGGQAVAMVAAQGVSGWLMDSGASQHMCGDRELFHEFKELSEPVDVVIADGQSLKGVGAGTVMLPSLGVNGLYLMDVLFVPGLSANLWSVSAATARGCEIVFKSNEAQVWRDERVCLSALSSDGKVYVLQGRSGCAMVAKAASAELWHRRLGHLGYGNMERLAKEGMVQGFDVSADEIAGADKHECDDCVLAKQVRAQYGASRSRKSEKVLELVHMDVCGPLQVPSLGGGKYFATFLDDFSRASAVRVIGAKSQVASVLKEVIAMWEAASGERLKTVRSDRGGEYVNGVLGDYFKAKGVVHQMTAPYTPEQNGSAERLNRTLVERVRALLFTHNMPLELWGEAVMTANFVRNRSPVKGQAKTPLELFTGVKPDVSRMRVFGCKAFVLVDKSLRKKLDPVSSEGVFVGYELTSKAYRVLLRGTGKVVVSNNVVFHENRAGVFTGERDASVKTLLRADELGRQGVRVRADEESLPGVRVTADEESLPGVRVRADEESLPGGVSDVSDEEGNGADASAAQQGGDGDDDAEQLDRAQRHERALRRYVVRQGRQRVHVATALSAKADEPTTYAEAMAAPDSALWKQAMDEEMTSLKANNTWELEELPEGVKPIPVKWVFRIKRDGLGNIERYKARLVAKGCAQVEGVDFNEVYAPVSKHTTLRALLSVVAKHDLELHQLDVKTAFLNGDLDEEIWMKQPPGYAEGAGTQACRLVKSLYGLRQAPRAWYTKLKTELEAHGFRASVSDAGLYVWERDGDCAYVIVWVDDMLIAAASLMVIELVKGKLRSSFDVHDLGEARTFLGMEISRDRKARTVKLTQARATEQLLSKFSVVDCKGRLTPMTPGVSLTGDGVELNTDEFPFATLIGSLLYLSVCTRADIAQAVGALARYMSAPCLEHWQLAKGILRYLAGTRTVGLMFGKGEGLAGFCDADFAGDVDTRRSTTGYAFILHGGAISWSSKLQPTVAASTVEAEYMAAAAAVKEALWLRMLCADLRIDVGTVKLLCDNQGCIRIMKDPIASVRSKHIDVLHHFARERVARREVDLVYVTTADMPADMLTKAVPSPKLQFCKAALGIE
jgi:hypothetical protein